jgi:hypothetical protein
MGSFARLVDLIGLQIYSYNCKINRERPVYASSAFRGRAQPTCCCAGVLRQIAGAAAASFGDMTHAEALGIKGLGP